MSKEAHLIVSPHCDDSVLSLGGHMLTEDNVRVVTLFGTCAWTTLPGEFTPDEITQMNQEEERLCMEDAGAEGLLYELPEALLRGYTEWNAKTLHADDEQLPEKAAGILLDHLQGVGKIYFPSAPGGHVDHVITRRLMNRLFSRFSESGIQVYLYEDLPYSWYGGLDESLDDIRLNYELTPHTRDITNIMDRKLQLLRHYRSQLADSDLDKVTEYASSVVPNGYGERIWHVTKP